PPRRERGDRAAPVVRHPARAHGGRSGGTRNGHRRARAGRPDRRFRGGDRTAAGGRTGGFRAARRRGGQAPRDCRDAGHHGRPVEAAGAQGAYADAATSERVMTRHEEWTDKLSDYLDGELSTADAAAVEAHLRKCPACADVLNDLRRIVVKARNLDARPPRRDLWPGIAARTDRLAGRRISFTLPQLVAAAVLLMGVSGTVVWQVAERSAKASRSDRLVATGSVEREASAERPEREAPAERPAVPVSFADAQYDAAVSDLEKALRAGRGRLDKST